MDYDENFIIEKNILKLPTRGEFICYLKEIYLM